MAMFIRTKKFPNTIKLPYNAYRASLMKIRDNHDRESSNMTSNQEELAQLQKLAGYTKTRMHHHPPHHTLWSPEEVEMAIKAKKLTRDTPPERTIANFLALKDDNRYPSD